MTAPTVYVYADTRWAVRFIHWFLPVAPFACRLLGADRFERWVTAVALRLVRVRVESAP